LYYLDKYFVDSVSSPKELEELIHKVKSGRRHFCMAIRDLLKFLEEREMIDIEIIEKFRKVVKISQTNVDTFVPSNEDALSRQQ